MLKNIHVKNFALIDEVEIDLNSGLNILTGETGAGKSIIIDAVNFALGERVSKDVVRDDASYALSELVFSIDKKEIKDHLMELDINPEDDEVIFQRKITNGKSTARINGETVTASVLKEVAALLIDIHGQHDNQSLLNKSAHISLLDGLLEDKLSDLLAELKDSYVNYNAKLSELKSLDEKSTNKDKEIAFLKYQCSEIDSANIVKGEDDDLEALYKKMNNARKIAEAVSFAHRLTGYDSEGAGASVGRALSQIRQISDLDDGASDLQLLLTDIDSLLNDFNRTVADYEDSLDFSQEEFNETESRLEVLNNLKGKYGKTLEDVLSYRGKIEEELNRYMDIDSYREKLSVETDSLKEKLLNLCESVSSIRKSGAKDIEKLIESALKDLNFLDAKFEISVVQDENRITDKGYDDVELLISTNPGERLKPLTQVASGGEMSRIMLAIKSVMAKKDSIPTLIFDEIDTGISGRTAQKVSEKMSMIAKDHQVICVTHLPQIAAMADAHFEIHKESFDGRTVTSIDKLSDDNVVIELARMLGGVEITEAVMENAREMKKQADALK